jgi:lysozyme family protein
MAQFEPAFIKTLAAEGGYVLHNVPGDTGGQTFAGIARNKNPQWPGWACIDRKDMEGAKKQVADFYRVHFWGAIKGDQIASQPVAEAIYDFAVNAGPKAAITLAQSAVGVVADGLIRDKTLDAWNRTDSASFCLKFAVGKISRYAAICNKNRDQSKFLLGWINRTLSQLGA